MADNAEFIREFLDESYENLDQLDQDFVALESDPRDAERLASVFRTIHTIKGTCGFFGFSKLGAIAHAGEHLLGRLRDGKLRLNQEITSGLLESVDAIREVLSRIEATSEEGDGDYRPLNDKLTALANKEQVDEEDAAARDVDDEDLPTVIDDVVPTSPSAADDVPGATGPIPEIEHRGATSEVTAASDAEDTAVDPPEQPTLPQQEVASDSNVKPAMPASEGSVRVDIGLLNRLMNQVSELVLARNQLLQHTHAHSDPALANVAQRLNQITSELQEGVTKTRMQAIQNVWSKFPRVVRDLAVKCGKEVRLVMEGDETELDRSLLESIRDPLTHLIRNAIDHGIESPDVRETAGKSREGTLSLHAFHAGGLVHIEIADDGAGIDVGRVRDKAIERRLVTVAQASAMNDDDVAQLIFLPGFSTASTVTDVSGRGVGMDVVRTNIEKVGGTIELRNRPGVGTTIRVKIPLTLAIIPALTVNSDGQRYAIPQSSLLEVLNLENDRRRQAIEYVHDKPVYRLRGELLPLVFLRDQLAETPEKSEVPSLRNACIAVLQADDQAFGLVVDSIGKSDEIVVKPLHPALHAIQIFSGATIMGDGGVTLILDIAGIARQAGMKPVQHAIRNGNGLREGTSGEQDGQLLLVCALNGDDRVAMPVTQVRRLEEINVTSIERSSGRDVVQYRGEIMPLVSLSQALGRPVSTHDDANSVHVVVTSNDQQSVGVVVRHIVDVVACPQRERPAESRLGLAGSAVINDRVTDIVDIQDILRTCVR